MQTERLCSPRRSETCCLKLTDTFARLSGETGAGVAPQPSLGVAGKPVAAGLPPLPGAHRAAPAAIRHQGDPWWALRGSGGAHTGAVAQLAPNLMETHAREQVTWERNDWKTVENLQDRSTHGLHTVPTSCLLSHLNRQHILEIHPDKYGWSLTSINIQKTYQTKKSDAGGAIPEIIIESPPDMFYNWVREAHLRNHTQQNSQSDQRVTPQSVHEVCCRR